MNKSPKKIWMMENPQAWATRDDMFNTPYIRADIVDELVEALKDAKCWSCRGIHKRDIAPKIEAALAKLEESHD